MCSLLSSLPWQSELCCRIWRIRSPFWRTYCYELCQHVRCIHVNISTSLLEWEEKQPYFKKGRNLGLPDFSTAWGRPGFQNIAYNLDFYFKCPLHGLQWILLGKWDILKALTYLGVIWVSPVGGSECFLPVPCLPQTPHCLLSRLPRG